MGSSSYSPSYLKLVSCRVKDDFLQFKSPLHHSPNNHRYKVVDFNFSISVSSSPRGVRVVSLSSSHAQAEVDNHQLLMEESAAEAETQTVGVQFQLQRECSFGQKFLLTGDHPILGLWDPHNAVSLTWSDGHIWTVHLDIPVGKCIKFKLIMQESGGKFVWQPGPDRILQCFQTQKIITLCEDWENPDSRIMIETDPTMNQEIQFVDTQEGYAIDMKEVLVSDEVVPVLVPGLSQLPVNEGPNDEPPEPVNGAANDLTLPELDSKGDTSNSNPRVSSIHENEECCENQHQATVEQEHEATQAVRSLLHNNDVQWSNINVVQKFLNIFGIQ